MRSFSNSLRRTPAPVSTNVRRKLPLIARRGVHHCASLQLDCASTVTSTEAQALRDDAAARGKWLIWTLTDTDLKHPGMYVGRAHEADYQGGTLLPGALVARTLDELRTMLPAGLTQQGPTSMLPPDVVETWD